MQKVFTDVTVTTKGGNTYSFLDSNPSIDGTSAMRSLNQKIAIDATEYGSIKRTFIPYEAIDSAVIEHSLGQEFAPKDANCVVKQDDVEPGTLTIFNNGNNIADIRVALKLGQPGTYPGNGRSYAFTADVSSQLGNGWYSTEYPITINVNGMVAIQEIPDGTEYALIVSGQTTTGTIPESVIVTGGGGGDPK